MNGTYKTSLLACLCMFASIALCAQPKAGAEPGGSNRDTLRMVVILSRHGVRAPTWTLDQLNAYSSSPWPAWSVQPGYLTEHGFELMRLFGAYDRASLARAGLLSAQGCTAASDTYIWADTDQRTLESGRALAKGLAPGCALQVHSLGEGVNDPLFHPGTARITAVDADAIFAQFAQRAAGLQDLHYAYLLTQMQRVLSGCKPDADCKPATPPQITLTGAKDEAVRGKSDKLVSLQGPLSKASTISEDFLLEYTEGMPMQSVAWGKIDEAQIIKFINLHTTYFNLMHRTPLIAKMEASSMLKEIASTLQQGVESKPVAGAIAPPGKKLVLLVGHDTNLGPIAELLGMHWNLDGRADDTPPGTELAFELWQTPEHTYRVRLNVAMQTLRQDRQAQQLTQQNPPAEQEVAPAACSENLGSCSWEEFRKAVAAATGK